MESEVAENFFGLAKAYLAAAKALAHAEDSEGTIPEWMASACMFNARLSVELFLKGMIVLRNPAGKFATHRLNELGQEFTRIYSERGFQWNIPFTVQFIGGSGEERAEALRKNLKNRPLDQVFRYPLDNNGKPWEMVASISSRWFLEFTDQIRCEMEQLERLAKSGA